MRNRLFGSLLIAAAMIAVFSLVGSGSGQARAAGQAPAGAYTPPRTPEGHPDLQGTWNYGTEMPLKHCATISIPDARSIVVQPHDKSIAGDIRKAIETSDIGVSPNVDGAVIRLSLPPLNEERRKDLVKLVHKRAEDGRVAVRNVRKDGHNNVQHAQRESKITEDEARRGNDQIQKITDKYVAEVDALVQSKEKEIMEV